MCRTSDRFGKARTGGFDPKPKYTTGGYGAALSNLWWAKRNLRKHGVAFDDAIAAFSDPFAMMKQDRIEGGERRWQTLGMVGGYFVLLVAHTVGESDDGTEVIRIISARAADRKERKRYENQDR